MIYLLTGEDHDKLEGAVQKIVSQLSLVPEKLAGDSLTENSLVDVLAATTLFTDKRLIIIRRLSENSALWNRLPDYLPRLSEDTTLILIEPKPDKRTVTFKTLKAVAQAEDFPKSVVEDNSKFKLFEEALKGNKQHLQATLETVKLSDDPYLLFGLIASQAFNLAAVWSAETSDDLGKDLGLKPYSINQFKALSRKLTKADIKRLTHLVADADWDIKNSRGEPWLVIEKLLLTI